jgi:hypothetical protein
VRPVEESLEVESVSAPVCAVPPPVCWTDVTFAAVVVAITFPVASTASTAPAPVPSFGKEEVAWCTTGARCTEHEISATDRECCVRRRRTDTDAAVRNDVEGRDARERSIIADTEVNSRTVQFQVWERCSFQHRA